MAGPSGVKISTVKIGILALAMAAYYLLPGVRSFVSTGMQFLHDYNFEGLRMFILQYGLWAPVTSIVLMALQSMVPLVPGLAITVTNAWIFGWQYGALYSWIGALLGAILDFGIARWYGRPVVEKFINAKYLDKTDAFFKKHGVLAVFISRLTPVVPFKVVSYGVGLTTISLLEFILATGIGQTPGIVLYSILGHNLTHSLHATIAVTSLLIIAGGCVYYFRDAIERHFFSNKE